MTNISELSKVKHDPHMSQQKFVGSQGTVTSKFKPVNQDFSTCLKQILKCNDDKTLVKAFEVLVRLLKNLISLKGVAGASGVDRSE